MKGGIASVPEWVWAPAMVVVATVLLGATGIWSGLPWLFPSLGPTIFLQAHRPELDSSRIYNVVVGHALGAAGGIAGVLISGAGQTPSFWQRTR